MEVPLRRASPFVVIALALSCAVVPLPSRVLAQNGGAAGGGGQRRTQPPRAQVPGAEQPRGTSTIRGFVVAADTGAPIRRAQVRAFSAESRDNRVTTTDDQGRFELRELVGGRYTVTASKGGFVTLQYGQRRPSEAGTPLDVAAGQTLEKVGIGLPRGSVIAGRVVDEYGEPVAGAQVTALRFAYAGGSRRAVGAAGAGANDRTDDQGSFRLFGLLPGEYVVSASLRGGQVMPFDTGTDDSASSGYAPTYYPGTPSLAEAQRITVGVGEEAPGVTFALTLTRLVRVSGRVLTSQGTPAAGVTVVAMQTDSLRGFAATGNLRGGQVRGDGTFEIAGVAPGNYVLIIRQRGGQDGEFGRAAITVGTADLAGVTITTGPGATASGRVVTDQGTPAPFRATEVRVTAVPAGDDPAGPFGGGPPPRVNDDFTFQLRGLADQRLIRVTPPQGWSLKAIELEGQDVTDTPLDFRAGGDVRNLRVVLTQAVTDVSGLVTDDRGAPLLDATVVVFPDDEARWTYSSRFVRTARPDQQGRYQIRGLPPFPRYLVAVVQGLEDGQTGDPEYLRSLEPAARPVALGEGETKSFDVRLR